MDEVRGQVPRDPSTDATLKEKGAALRAFRMKSGNVQGLKVDEKID
jgi:hypothetical protein